MAFLMVALLAVFLIVAYKVGNKDFLSPWFLLCGMIAASFIIVLLNYFNWEVKINIQFIVYISIAILSFGLGSLLVNRAYRVKKTKASFEKKVSVDEADIKRKYPTTIFLCISIVCTGLYVFKLFIDNPGTASLGERLRAIYDNTVNNNYSPGIIFNQMREIITAIAYVNTYRLLVKLHSKKDKVSVLGLLLPIILFFIMFVFTTDRNIFLRYAIYFVCLYIWFFYENCKKKNVNIKLIKRVILFGVVFVGIFFVLGKMKQYSSGIFRALGIYGGSGLYNFNLWVKAFDGPFLYGKATFSTFLGSLKTVLSIFGIPLNIETLSRFDSYIIHRSANGYVYSSNIYSALKPFIEDFGIFGAFLFPFVMGLFYQWLYLKAKKTKYGFGWVIYSMLIYPVLFFPIAEQLFGRFNLGFIYELVWLAIVYFYAFGRRKRREKSLQDSKKKETSVNET